MLVEHLRSFMLRITDIFCIDVYVSCMLVCIFTYHPMTMLAWHACIDLDGRN